MPEPREIACPKGHTFSTKANRGVTVRCPDCGEKFRAPASQAAGSSSPPPPVPDPDTKITASGIKIVRNTAKKTTKVPRNARGKGVAGKKSPAAGSAPPAGDTGTEPGKSASDPAQSPPPPKVDNDPAPPPNKAAAKASGARGGRGYYQTKIRRSK